AITRTSAATSVAWTSGSFGQDSLATNGASTTGTNVVVEKISGATRVTGRVCRAEFSASDPKAAAVNIPASQTSRLGNARCDRSSAKNFVERPSHENARPAATPTNTPSAPPTRETA